MGTHISHYGPASMWPVGMEALEPGDAAELPWKQGNRTVHYANLGTQNYKCRGTEKKAINMEPTGCLRSLGSLPTIYLHQTPNTSGKQIASGTYSGNSSFPTQLKYAIM